MVIIRVGITITRMICGQNFREFAVSNKRYIKKFPWVEYLTVRRKKTRKYLNKDVSGSSQTHGSAYTYVLYILISKKESGFLGLRVLESLKNYKITSEKMNDVPS